MGVLGVSIKVFYVCVYVKYRGLVLQRAKKPSTCTVSDLILNASMCWNTQIHINHRFWLTLFRLTNCEEIFCVHISISTKTHTQTLLNKLQVNFQQLPSGHNKYFGDDKASCHHCHHHHRHYHHHHHHCRHHRHRHHHHTLWVMCICVH